MAEQFSYEAVEAHMDEAVGGPFAHVPYSDGHEDPEVDEIIAHSRMDRPVNRLSTEGVDGLVNSCRQRNRLVTVNIVTGSSNYNTEALLSRFKNDGSSSSAQVTVPAGSQAEADLDAWADEAHERYYQLAVEDRPRGPVPTPASERTKAYLVNVAHLVWRFNHRFPGGECKLLLHGFELSHFAEGYDMHPWPPFPGDGEVQSTYVFPPAPVRGWRVEHSGLESYALNDTRKTCARFGLMWRKPDGQLITEDDYVGPTMCFHQGCGQMPCFAPRPSADTGWAQIGVEELEQFIPKRQKTRASGRKRPLPPQAAVQDEEDAE